MQVTNWYLPVSWISIIVTQTWCDSVLWWFSGVIHGQKWAQNQPKLDIWVIFEVWKGRKTAKNGSFLRPEVWPTDQILAKKKSGPQKFKSSQKKLIPAQLGKFLGSKVGPFWPSDCLRGPPRKSKMQKIFRARRGRCPPRAPPVGGSAPEPPANEGRPPRPAEKSDPLWTQKFQLNPAKENLIPAENNLIPAENNLIPAEKKI